jgi:hypothetical protein
MNTWSQASSHIGDYVRNGADIPTAGNRRLSSAKDSLRNSSKYSQRIENLFNPVRSFGRFDAWLFTWIRTLLQGRCRIHSWFRILPRSVKQRFREMSVRLFVYLYRSFVQVLPFPGFPGLKSSSNQEVTPDPTAINFLSFVFSSFPRLQSSAK